MRLVCDDLIPETEEEFAATHAIYTLLKMTNPITVSLWAAHDGVSVNANFSKIACVLVNAGYRLPPCASS